MYNLRARDDRDVRLGSTKTSKSVPDRHRVRGWKTTPHASAASTVPVVGFV